MIDRVNGRVEIVATRAILDTNVWSRLAEADAGVQLRGIANAAKIKIVVAPSVVFELARMPNPSSRRRAIAIVTKPEWSRLMPEAYLESAEIIGAIRRRRPSWLIPRPELADYNRLLHGWRARNLQPMRPSSSPKDMGFWQKVRSRPDQAAAIMAMDNGVLEAARFQSRDARQEMIEQEVRTPGPLRSVMARFKVAPKGVKDGEWEAWRGETMVSLRHALFESNDGTYRDWISPFIDLHRVRLDFSSWANFWLYEVEAEEVPRQWLRWATSFQQRFRKVSNGAPGDTQLSAYLTDGDIIFSADKPFVELIAECEKYAPTKIARPVCLPPAEATVGALFDALQSHRA